MDNLEDQTCREDFREAYKDFQVNEASKKKMIQLTKLHNDEISRIDICNLIDELRTGDENQNKKVTALKDALFHILNEVTIKKPRYLDAIFFLKMTKLRSLTQILFDRYLHLAIKTLDVCVFTISNDYLSWALYDLHKKGVKVRIITDDECSSNKGSDIQDLADAGILCRLDNDPTAHMHNKYCVLDGHILINGSFNWTQSAVDKNQENLSIIDSDQLCAKYSVEFENYGRNLKMNKLKEFLTLILMQTRNALTSDNINKSKRTLNLKNGNEITKK